MNDPWKLVTEYTLHEYPIGIKQGDRLRLTQELVIHDHQGKPTGVVHPVGEVWSVLPGVADEPAVIWLRPPDGKTHTWDADVFFDWFQPIEAAGE